jgi:hypothetical protein
MRLSSLLLACGLACLARGGETVDLLARYPTTLTAGDVAPNRAREWQFSANDIFRLAGFTLEVGQDLRVEIGAADLGVGHCVDGAVWAVVIPGEPGRLSSSALPGPETIRHVWLRFHPKEIARLFPSNRVLGDGNKELEPEIRAIAQAKFGGSWHAGARAMIPEPKDLTVDLDTPEPRRRFFTVDRDAGTARYVAAFEKRAVRPPPAITAALAAESFDQLWGSFDRDYAMFILRPEVDWAALRTQFRGRAVEVKSAYAFATVCAEMLKPLRDLHIWMDVAGTPVPVFNRERQGNANPSATRKLLGALETAGPRVQWAKTSDRIGYIVIHQWNDAAIPRQVDEVLEQMRDTRGLIIDVRLNGGGSEPQAEEVAGRFLDGEFVYAFSQFRNGPQHTNLTEKSPRTASPRGPWRYGRPVVLLIGQKCMSSNESFVAMMTGASQVTTMGDRTCGSSGNPRMVRLPIEVTVSLPRWVDFLPDGTPLDERGVQPQVPFKAQPGAFDGDRDDLLTAALERLRQVPLPEKPIAGPALPATDTAQRPRDPGLADPKQDMQTEAKDPRKPKVISVFPADGAQEVESITELRLRFDRPMDPLSAALDWTEGGTFQAEFPRYDQDRHEFVFPVRLLAGAAHEIVVNRATTMGTLAETRALFCREGFQTPDHQLAALHVWRFRTKAAAKPGAGAPPKVISLEPASGSQVPLLCFAEIRFDQPMMSPSEVFPYVISDAMPWDRAELIGSVKLDVDQQRYRVPLLLPPKQKLTIALSGFRSAAGIASEPVRFAYESGESVYSPGLLERRKQATQDARLLGLLQNQQQQRGQVTSLVERVQTLLLTREAGRITRLRATAATFKWRAPNLFVADAAGPMLTCAAFTVGCDGQNAWWHYESREKKRLVLCPVAEMHRMNLSVGDPFGLTARSTVAAVEAMGLAYAGTANLDGRNCQVIEAWSAQTVGDKMSTGSLTQWCLDDQNPRVVRVSDYGMGFELHSRFLYDAVNEPIPDSVFAPPGGEGLKREAVEPLEADFTQRFLNARDGADGRMSVRWGKQGPKSSSSSGLN